MTVASTLPNKSNSGTDRLDAASSLPVRLTKRLSVQTLLDYNFVVIEKHVYSGTLAEIRHSTRKCVRGVTAYIGVDIVGWVWLYHREFIHIYVIPTFRRKGIGTQLIAAAQTMSKRRLSGTAWDERSTEFFKKTGVIL
jgi:GNAT superfamily N-acetyltransferase